MNRTYEIRDSASGRKVLVEVEYGTDGYRTDIRLGTFTDEDLDELTRALCRHRDMTAIMAAERASAARHEEAERASTGPGGFLARDRAGRRASIGRRFGTAGTGEHAAPVETSPPWRSAAEAEWDESRDG